MRMRLRSILPPGWVLVLFALLYVLADVLVVALAMILGRHSPAEFLRYSMFDLAEIPWLSQFVLLWACFFWGVYRIAAMHPVFREDYRHWLAASAWSAGKPLPAGPVHLVWQDVAILLVITGLALRYPARNPLEFAGLFLLVYLLGAAVVLSLLQAWVAPYATAVGLGVALLAIDKPFEVAGILIGLYAITWFELRRTLRDFPWNLGRWEAFLRTGALKGQPRPQLLGWPFQLLSPRMVNLSVSAGPAILLSVLAGWWFYVAAVLSLPWERGDIEPLYGAIIALGILSRIMAYCVGYLSPLSVAGRLLTMRWIIPGYDKIFIGPAVTAFAGCFLPRILLANGWSDLNAFSFSLAIVFLLLLLTGPSLRNWRLTGKHRLLPIMPRQEFVRI